MSVQDIRAVQIYREIVEELQERAAELKETPTIEPPLTETELGDAIRDVLQRKVKSEENCSPQSHYAAVETAFREEFYELVVGCYSVTSKCIEC